MPVAEGSEGPIIMLKKKAGHGGHHSGAWKVAYADFVTAMMALFIVLWLLSSSEKVKKAVGSYFSGSNRQRQADGQHDGRCWGRGLTLTKDDMNQLKQKLKQAMKTIPKFEQMKNNIELTITSEGLRVELIETEKGCSSRAAARIRVTVAKSCWQGWPQKSAICRIHSDRGHTDAKPYAGAASYSNWELSADRANSARRLMQENGMRPNQVMQVRGFADQRLRVPADPLAASNRRVSVIIQYLLDNGDPASGSAAKPAHESKPRPATAAKAATPQPAQPAHDSLTRLSHGGLQSGH
jgi:chemotaxis protein MotB